MNPNSQHCQPTTENDSALDRRSFLKLAGSAASALSLVPWNAIAGPFVREDFEKLVPVDKRLSPEWLRSLTERGERTVYRGAELRLIGMPIGGFCAGQVYLGGDGKLWHWDVFNRRITTGAEHYAKPLKPTSPFDTGFALRVTAEGRVHERAFDMTQWDRVTFNGEYPIGRVEYSDAEIPVTVALEAFSPFIPLKPMTLHSRPP
jgi:hypothetical protein